MVLSPGQLEVLCNTLKNTLRDHNSGLQFYPSRANVQLLIIQKEYLNTPILREEYPEGDLEFMNDLFGRTFGFTYELKNGQFIARDVTPVGKFSQKVDLLSTIEYLIQKYPFKSSQYPKSLLELEVKTSDGPITFKAGFNDNVWNTIYKKKSEARLSLFNKGDDMIASYLHSASSNIHQLEISSSVEGIVCTAFVMSGMRRKPKRLETNDGHEYWDEEYVIVDNIIGDFKKLTKYNLLAERVCYFLWDALSIYAAAQRKACIYVNTTQEQMSTEMSLFLEFLKKGYNIPSEEMKKMQSVISVPQSVQYSYDFEKSHDLPLIQHISLRSRDTFLYHGEQYTHSFPVDENKTGNNSLYRNVGGFSEGLLFRWYVNPQTGGEKWRTIRHQRDTYAIPSYHFSNGSSPLDLFQFKDSNYVFSKKSSGERSLFFKIVGLLGGKR